MKQILAVTINALLFGLYLALCVNYLSHGQLVCGAVAASASLVGAILTVASAMTFEVQFEYQESK